VRLCAYYGINNEMSDFYSRTCLSASLWMVL